jgi:hypothetical protein
MFAGIDVARDKVASWIGYKVGRFESVTDCWGN